MPLVREAAERRAASPSGDRRADRMLALAAAMGSLPSAYLWYYYFRDEALEEARTAPTTRAQDILAEVDGYWAHYREQAAAAEPVLDPARSRGGILELELAVDVIDAWVNDTGETWPVNVPNAGGALPGLPDDLVVEVPGRVAADGITPLPVPALPREVTGLIQALGASQALTAEAAWSGTRRDAVAALAGHPLVLSLTRAEAIYDEMAAAHRAWLPDRLLR